MGIELNFTTVKKSTHKSLLHACVNNETTPPPRSRGNYNKNKPIVVALCKKAKSSVYS